MNDIDIIEQLTIAVEQAGVNLAPPIRNTCHWPLPWPTVAVKRDVAFSTAFAACPTSTGRMKRTSSTAMPCSTGGEVIPWERYYIWRNWQGCASTRNLQTCKTCSPLTPTHLRACTRRWINRFACLVSRTISGLISCNR